MLDEIRRHRIMFLMVLPTLILIITFNYLPMVGLYLAFTDYNFNLGILKSPFIGLKNFQFLFQSGTLFKITRNTLLYNAAFILLTNLLQMFTAILISRLSFKWLKKITQSVIFLPYFISYVLIGTFAYNALNYDYGAVNGILRHLGMEPVNFYTKPEVWPLFMVLFYIWKNLGYGTVVYLASIMSIDKAMYESAEIDGANSIQQIQYITIPQLMGTFILLLLFALGSIMRGQFELFYQIIGNNGILFNNTDVIDTYVYRALTVQFNIGLGSAAGLYQSAFGFTLIMIVNGLIRKFKPEYALF